MNAKTEQKERSHETILESASRLLREKGISGARVAEVMHGAGLTVGGFYAHFASKEALVDETLKKAGSEMRERLFTRLDEKPAADKAETILKRYLSTAHRDDFEHGCALPAVVGEIGTTAHEHAPALAEEIEFFASGLEEHVAKGGALSTRTVALGLVALMYGALSLSRALRGGPLSEEILKASRALGAAAAKRS